MTLDKRELIERLREIDLPQEALRKIDVIIAEFKDRIAHVGDATTLTFGRSQRNSRGTTVDRCLNLKEIRRLNFLLIEGGSNLLRYADQYHLMSEEDKARITWQEIKERLEANEGRYLKLAEAMERGGTLFGVDKAGNPLIADAGNEPIMKGMNYWDTREAVYGKAGEETGYEMFRLNPDDCYESEEILAYEKVTGKPFVFCPETDNQGKKIPEEKRWRSSWLDNGTDPQALLLNEEDYKDAPCAVFTPFQYSGKSEDPVSMDYSDKLECQDERGVRRLLRVYP